MSEKIPYLFNHCNEIFKKYIATKDEQYIEELESEAYRYSLASAYYFLGYIYYYEIGLETDNSKVRELNLTYAKGYLESAIDKLKETEQDDNRMYRIHNLLAWIYESGELGESDCEKAYLLYLEGIKSDEPSFSYQRLGYLSYWGYGCKQNFSDALKYFEKSNSDLGDLYLGEMYRDGTGVKQDYKKAVAYFNSAIEKGNEEAKEYLEEMKR